jgi:hypothetical protein
MPEMFSVEDPWSPSNSLACEAGRQAGQSSPQCTGLEGHGGEIGGGRGGEHLRSSTYPMSDLGSV